VCVCFLFIRGMLASLADLTTHVCAR
jgi:hypothetical protein